MFKMASSIGLSKLKFFFYSEHSDKAFILYLLQMKFEVEQCIHRSDVVFSGV